MWTTVQLMKPTFELGDSYSFEDTPNILWYDLYSDNNDTGNRFSISCFDALLVISSDIQYFNFIFLLS